MKWLHIEHDLDTQEIVSELLDELNPDQGAEMAMSVDNATQGRAYFKRDRYDGVIADYTSRSILQSIHSGRLTYPGFQGKDFILVLTSLHGLEDYPGIIRVEPHDNPHIYTNRIYEAVQRHSPRDVFRAAREDDLEKLELLLSRHPELLEAREPSTGNGLLVAATECNNYGATEYLLQRGADVGATNLAGETALHAGPEAPITALLLQHGALADQLNNAGLSPADIALQYEFYDSFRLLAEAVPGWGSPNYQLLRYALRERYLVEGTYQNQSVTLSVVELGQTDNAEHCLSCTDDRWLCAHVASLENLELGRHSAGKTPSHAPPACVAESDPKP